MKRYPIKKMMCTTLILCIIAAGLAGCLGREDREPRPLENGVLKVGMNLHINAMCYLSGETSKPEGFEVEIAQKLAEKRGLKLEIIDTSEENLLKSLDAKLYDCVISAVGVSDWNRSHYSHTAPYADIAEVKEQTGLDTECTQIAVFTKKWNSMVKALEKDLEEMKEDGTIKEISEKYFEKDITIY